MGLKYILKENWWKLSSQCHRDWDLSHGHVITCVIQRGRNHLLPVCEHVHGHLCIDNWDKGQPTHNRSQRYSRISCAFYFMPGKVWIWAGKPDPAPACLSNSSWIWTQQQFPAKNYLKYKLLPAGDTRVSCHYNSLGLLSKEKIGTNYPRTMTFASQCNSKATMPQF